MTDLPSTRRTADLVYARLRDGISAGEFTAGERLDLDQIARSLAVSRTPVREAVLRLDADGFLITEPYRGVTVAAVDERYVDEILALRVHTEGLAAFMGCVQLTDDELDKMQSLLAELDEVDHTDHAEFARLNGAFHGILYQAARAPRLLAIVETLGRHAERIRLHYRIARNVNVASQHRAILDACVRRDASAAQRAMRAHILGVLVEMAKQPEIALSAEHLQFLPAVLDAVEREEFFAQIGA